MKKLNIFLVLILFGFGIGVPKAYSAGELITMAPNLATMAAVPKLNFIGTRHNARLAIAPYAQVVPNSSYTFIGVSHPSLGTAHTSIGLVIEAMDMSFTTTAGNSDTKWVEKARAAVFTVNAGDTHRVFIVNEGHATINTSNTAFNNAKTHIIATSDVAQFGNIRVTSIGTEPNRKSTADAQFPKGNYVGHTAPATPAHGLRVMRYNNLNQLAMWGVVYQEDNGAGFGLEFVGDMHDSNASGVATWSGVIASGHSVIGLDQTTAIGGVGRGVN